MSFKRNGFVYKNEEEYDEVMSVEADSVAMGIQEDYPALKKWRHSEVDKFEKRTKQPTKPTTDMG